MKRIIFGMLLLSTILLWYQWMMYAETNDTENIDMPFIDVAIVEKDNRIEVEQKIVNLSGGTYYLNVPHSAENLSCYISEEVRCEMNENELTIDEINEVTFNFYLHKDDEFIYLTDPIISLDGINSDVKLTLSSSLTDNEKWVGSKRPFFTEQLTNIDYYEWEYESLDPIVLAKISDEFVFNHEIGQVQIHSKIPINIDDYTFIDSFIEKPHLMLIASNEQEFVDNGFSIVNHLEKRKMASSLFMSHLMDHDLHDEDMWILKAISSYFYGIDANDDHSEIVSLLKESLNENEKETWFDLLINWDDETTDLISVLDKTIQEATGLNTFFFSHNVNNDTLSPLYGFDDRPIVLNGEVADVNWKNIVYQDEHYIPIAGLADLIGFHLIGLNNGREIFIEFDAHRYRFFSEGDLFIINEENYRIQDNAIIRIDNEVYIHTRLAADIFPIQMTLLDDSLEIRRD